MYQQERTTVATRADLTEWVYEAVRENGGQASLLEVAKAIWSKHEAALRGSGDLFFTWQYDMRWSAQTLRNTGKFKAINESPRHIWQIVP